MEKKDKSLKKMLELFVIFFKIGAFTFGGGYAMISLVQMEVSERRKMISERDILDIVAIAESTPGPYVVNAATFVGYKVSGVGGAFFATLGVVLPSFVIISIISRVLNAFSSYNVVKYAFFGIRAGVLALVVKALVGMFKQCPKNVISYIIMFIALIIVVGFKINVLYVIIASALIGLAYSLIAKKEAE